METTSQLLLALRHHIGSGNYYHHPLNKKCYYTDGVRDLFQRAKAFWLLDIFITELYEVARYIEVGTYDMELEVFNNRTAQLILHNYGNRNAPLFIKELNFTDFPIGKIGFIVGNHGEGRVIICLPQED